MEHDPAFESILPNWTNFLIWRVENLALVPLARENYGKFHKGDSYVIYSAFEKGESNVGVATKPRECYGKQLQQYIHFWQGSETSTDEAGVAAIKAIELDDFLGGAPVQQREVEGSESLRFISYFKDGIRILQGGVASGFHHVTDDFKPALYSVKGKRTPMIHQLASITWSLMNEGDVYVLDNRSHIFVWIGRSANNNEKLNGAKLAQSLKDQYGASEIVFIGDGEEFAMSDDELTAFNSLLPLGKKKLNPLQESRLDTQEDETVNEIKLYRCTDEDGTLKVIQVKNGPLFQSDLTSNDSYIIDNGQNGVFVWVGKHASKLERSEAMRNGHGFALKKNYSTKTNVTRVIDGGEPAEFRSLFSNWKVADESVGFGKQTSVNRIAKVEHTDFDANLLHEKTHIAADTGMVDDGSGKKDIFRLVGKDLVAVPTTDHGKFYAGDCYIITYTYHVGGAERCIIYYWLGITSGQDEKGIVSVKAVELDNKMNGRAVQIRVTQGKEPRHFMAIFGGRLIIYSGGHASAFEAKQGEVDEELGKSYMLEVRDSGARGTKAIQVPMKASSLNSNDVFVIVTPDGVHMWCGKGSTGDEREMAKIVANKESKADFFIVSEGFEKEDFWTMLGGKEDYCKDRRTAEEYSKHEPRLFHCSNATGNLKVEELLDFTQNDLVEEDVMILDAHTSVFIWIGVRSVPEELKLTEKLVFDYLKSDPKGRDSSIPICKIYQGYEPPTFTGFFGAWEPKAWENHANFEKMTEKMRAENPNMTFVLADENSSEIKPNYYPLDVLLEKEHPLPDDVDPTNKELNLHDRIFEKVFKMNRQSYMALPMWKRQNLKKSVGLY